MEITNDTNSRILAALERLEGRMEENRKDIGDLKGNISRLEEKMEEKFIKVTDRVIKLEERKSAKKAARNPSIKVSVEISEQVDWEKISLKITDEASLGPKFIEPETFSFNEKRDFFEKPKTPSKGELKPQPQRRRWQLQTLVTSPNSKSQGTIAEGKPQAQVTVSSEDYFGASKPADNDVKCPRGDLQSPDPTDFCGPDTHVSTAPTDQSVLTTEECHASQEAKREPVDDHKSPGGLEGSFGHEHGGIQPREKGTSVGRCDNKGEDADHEVLATKVERGVNEDVACGCESTHHEWFMLRRDRRQCASIPNQGREWWTSAKACVGVKVAAAPRVVRALTEV